MTSTGEKTSSDRIFNVPVTHLCKWCGGTVPPDTELQFRCPSREYAELCEPAAEAPRELDIEALETMCRQATAGILALSMPDGSMLIAATHLNILELIEKARRA